MRAGAATAAPLEWPTTWARGTEVGEEAGGVGRVVGDAHRRGRVAVRAYGWPLAALNDSLRQRLMAYALLHRYSNLAWFLERWPPAEGVRSLSDLARQWLPLEP